MTDATYSEAPPIADLDAQLAARPLEQVVHRARYMHGEPGPMDATDEAYAGRIAAAVRKWLEVQPVAPIPMVLHCPACGTQHIDEATEDWPNPPHRSHLCGTCGVIWRPADVPTVGVARVSTQSDNWPACCPHPVTTTTNGVTTCLECRTLVSGRDEGDLLA